MRTVPPIQGIPAFSTVRRTGGGFRTGALLAARMAARAAARGASPADLARWATALEAWVPGDAMPRPTIAGPA